MQNINPYSIPPLISSVLIFTLGLLVYFKKKDSRATKIFLTLSLSAALWLSFYSINFYLSYSDQYLPTINTIFRIGYCGVALIQFTYFHYLCSFFNYRWIKPWLIVNYTYSLVLLYFILKTNLIVSGLNKFFWGYYPAAGSLHPYFVAYFILLVTVSLSTLLVAILKKKDSPNKLNQYKYLLAGFGTFSIACLDFIPNYGIEIYPIGYIPTLIFICIVSYAIAKHQLMDIRLVFKKSLIYSLLISLITVTYFLFVFFIHHLSQGLLGYKSFLTSILFATIISLTFIPLRNFLHTFIDKAFFKGTPLELAEQNQLFQKEIIETEKYKTLATLSSGFAHEIRNPLTAIKTFSEKLPEKLNDKEFLKKFSKIVGHEIDRINDLVTQLIDYSRPSMPNPKPTSIYKLISDTLNFLNSNLIKNNINVACNFPANQTLLISLDQNQIRQALLNIILNAIDAMPNGGTLTVSVTPLVVQTINNIQISIKDTGCGIESADIAQIFDPFFTKKYSGTGLGLAITQTIINNHGGKISVKSTVGVGTEFTIELPLKKEG